MSSLARRIKSIGTAGPVGWAWRDRALCGAVSIACATLASQAIAQQAPPQSTQAAPSGGQIASDGASSVGEVIVTARRRAESLENTPVSIVALSQRALTEKVIASSFDLSKAVPGLTVSADSGNAGLPVFSIRGKGQNYGAAAGSVETYFADVPLSAPFEIPTLPPQFFDLQSIQVLKGPQGTLFGRSTTGGAVVIVPQAPTDTFEGYGRIQGGTYGDFQAEGAVNLPLAGDKADLRLAVFDWQRAGYMHTYAGTNLANGEPLPPQTYENVDTTEFRATLRLRPSEGLENTTLLTFHYDKTRSSSGAGLNLAGLGPSNGLGAFETPGYDTRSSFADTDLTKPGTKVWAVINTTTYDLTSNLLIKNIFGYINASGYTNDAADDDGSNVGALSIDLQTPPRPIKNQQITDEVQLQGHDFGDRLTWIAGGLLDLTREPGGLDTIDISSQVLDFGSPSTTFEQNNVNSYGLFGSATFKITNKLSATAGYRHSWDDVALATENVTGFVSNASAAGLQHFQKASQGNTYNVDLEYRVTADTLVYGGYRHGYKRGGFNVSAPSGNESFDPETIDDFYVGLKDKFVVASMDGHFNIEAYYDLYHEMQVSYLSLNSTGTGLATITTNVPATTFRGFDTDLAIDATQWLTLTAIYSFIDAFNTSWPDNTSLVPGLTANLAGNPVGFVSKNKFTISARLHRNLPDGMGELALLPSVNYQDKFYTTATAAQLPLGEVQVLGAQVDSIAHGAATVPAYATVDLRLEWNHVWGSRIDAAVTATNLANKLYLLGTSATLNFGIEGDAYGPPRMVTFELSTKF